MIDYLKDAKRGDEIWFYDSQRNRYAADGKTYEGRGVWSALVIDGHTKQSIIIRYGKFDNKTGIERAKNGFSSGNRVAGQKEMEAFVWMDRNDWRLKQSVSACHDIDILKQIAALVGYQEQ